MFGDLDLNWVISSRDSFYIPFNRCTFEYTLEVVNKGNEEKWDKDTYTAYKESLNLSVFEFFIIYDAWNLDKEVRFL